MRRNQMIAPVLLAGAALLLTGCGGRPVYDADAMQADVQRQADELGLTEVVAVEASNRGGGLVVFRDADGSASPVGLPDGKVTWIDATALPGAAVADLPYADIVAARDMAAAECEDGNGGARGVPTVSGGFFLTADCGGTGSEAETVFQSLDGEPLQTLNRIETAAEFDAAIAEVASVVGDELVELHFTLSASGGDGDHPRVSGLGIASGSDDCLVSYDRRPALGFLDPGCAAGPAMPSDPMTAADVTGDRILAALVTAQDELDEIGAKLGTGAETIQSIHVISEAGALAVVVGSENDNAVQVTLP